LPTGGYAYDRRLLAEWQKSGVEASHLALPGSFPNPTDADMAATGHALLTADWNAVLLIDGLAYGAMPSALLETVRSPIVALVHHPLCLEAGLSAARAKELHALEKAALAFARHTIVTSRETAAAEVRSSRNVQSALEATMRKTENADVLERSVFLNTLIARKGISWTRLFGDLESVMPHNVRLVAIRHQADPKNGIQLEMTVGSQSVEPVVDLLKRMEGSGIFSVPSVNNCLPPSQSEPLYRCRVSVTYAQKL